MAISQVWAYDATGPIGCGDLWLDRLWTFLEVDGDLKYGPGSGRTILLEEKQRQERLEDAGFGVARIAARDVRDGDLLVTRIRQGKYSWPSRPSGEPLGRGFHRSAASLGRAWSARREAGTTSARMRREGLVERSHTREPYAAPG